MMKKIVLLAFAVYLFSCVDDEGNYKYKPVNEVSIEGIESRYDKMSKVDTVKLSPAIKGTLDGERIDNYEYRWYFCDSDKHDHTEISNEKDLVFPVNLEPGSYPLYFEIKDKKTGLKWLASTSLSVSTAVTKGFMILGDLEDGRIALDMVTMPAGRDTSVIEDVFNNSKYDFTGAEKLLFAGARAGMSSQTLWMMTREGSHRLTNSSAFEYIAEVNNFGLIETEYEHKTPIRIMDMFPHPSTINRSASYRGYITEDMVVQNMIISAEYYTTPCNRYSTATKALFKPYPLAFVNGVNYSGYSCTIIYDMDADCFVKLNGYFGATYCLKMSDYSSDPFPWNQTNTGRKIVYGENSYDGSYGSSYAIMKDSENHYIYKFVISSQYSITKSPLYTVDLSIATDFDKASHYAFAADRTAIVYSVGSVLYLYDYGRKQITSRNLGADITYLEAEYCSVGNKDAFLVASYDTSEKGIIRKLKIGTDPNKVEFIDLPRQVWKTRLNVKDIKWKNTP